MSENVILSSGHKIMNTVLLIAFEYPPAKSAGVERTLAFSKYLTDFGWQPIVLTVKEGIYDKIDHSRKIPDHVYPFVFRSRAVNVARDLSFRGKYPDFLNIPDRWSSWILGGVFLGNDLIKKHKPDLIWSTYPVASAHLLALLLSKLHKIPWVCDYRDPMPFHYGGHKLSSMGFNRWLEKSILKNCDRSLFVTPEMLDLYTSHYPEYSYKFNVIQNGYDEENFNGIGDYKKNDSIFRLIHSGFLYENGRDPSPLLVALGRLKQSGKITKNNFNLIFRGDDKSSFYKDSIDNYGLTDVVNFLPSIDHRQSLIEMFSCDALLVIQGGLYKNQIPGKIYDYLRVGKPILALTPEKSSLGKFLSEFNFAMVSERPDDLVNMIDTMINNPPNVLFSVEQYSRYEKCRELAHCFDCLVRR